MPETRAKILLATLAWADAFGMPLSAVEAWKWLLAPTGAMIHDKRQMPNGETGLGEVESCLRELVQDGKVGMKWGFYFLRGKGELVEQRTERLKIADEKGKKLLRVARWLRVVPFLRAVFASGSLAIDNTHEESDIDVFLVTAQGRIFTARLFVILLLKIFGRYRTGEHIRDQLCPNHYVTEQSLEVPFRTLYTAHLYATFVRVWSRDPDMLKKFWQANSWIGDYFALQAGMLGTSFSQRRTLPDPLPIKIMRGVLEWILRTPLGDFFEHLVQRLQRDRIAKNPLTKNPGSGHVVANDQMLAFHPNSPEQGTLDKYKNSMLLLGLSEGSFD